jgi:DnaK suppressor protein
MPRAKQEVAVQEAQVEVAAPGKSNGSDRKLAPAAHSANEGSSTAGVAKTGVVKGTAKEVRAVKGAVPKEPATKGPVAKDAVAKEPVAKKTASKETAAKQAATTHSATKQSATKEKVTVAKEPVAKETVVKEPLVNETVAGDPVAQGPGPKEAVANGLVPTEPVTKEHVAKEPVAKEPVVHEHVAKEAVVHEHVAKEAVAKEAKAPVKHVREEVPASGATAGADGAEAHKAHRTRPAVPKHSDGAGGPSDHGEPREQFLEHQRGLLMAERRNYTRQAEELRAQAEALALEHEPGDVQFDEEGGEGGTANVDRELDLHLSAQAQAAIDEIDAALDKITAGTYGFCESCGSPVPKARLEALPHARLCVSCKSGGLSARRQ